MSLILYDVFVFFLIIFDMYMHKKQITSLAIIALIYTALININNFIFASLYDFNIINNTVLIILSMFFSVIFIIDGLFGLMSRSVKIVPLQKTIRFKNYNVVTILFLVGVVAYFLQFVQLVNVYGFDLKGRNNGILGHLSSLSYILGPVSIDLAISERSKTKSILSIVFSLFVFGLAVVFGGKYVIFINAVYFLLYFIMKRNNKVDIWKLIKIAIPLSLFSILVFFLIYYLVPKITGKHESSFDFVIRHMMEYLLGPIVANNYTMSNPGQGEAMIPYTVFLNIGRALLGTRNYVNPIYPFVFEVGPTYITNVSGFFGELVYDLGLVKSILYTAVTFGIINIFYFQYRVYNRFYLSFCYINAMIVFFFFCNFITVSGVILPFFLALAIDILSMFRIGDYHI